MKYGKHIKQTSSMKSTKRALIASAACTILCGLLLFSTSIAWFSADRKSGANELYSGNLDIELSYSKTMADDWKEVEPNTDDIFKVGDKNMLWESGAVNVVYFKIENKGSLAAKYDFTVEIAEEVEGTNFDNNKFKLSDYIYGGAKEVNNAFVGETEDAKRNAAIDAVKNNEKTLQQIHTGAPLITGKMEGIPVTGTSEKQEKTFALVLYMPDDTGDDTNYKTPTDEEKRPSVKLKVKLVATQMTGESDSFGDQYDTAAYTKVDGVSYVKNAAALTKALSEANDGEKIKLTEDISASDGIKLDKNVAVDLGQNTLTSSTFAALDINGSNIPSLSNGTVAGYVNVNGDSKVGSVENVTFNRTNTGNSPMMINGECNSISNVKFIGKGEYAIHFGLKHDGKTCNISNLDVANFTPSTGKYIYVAKGTVNITDSNIDADKIEVGVNQDNKYTATVTLNGATIATAGDSVTP